MVKLAPRAPSNCTPRALRPSTPGPDPYDLALIEFGGQAVDSARVSRPEERLWDRHADGSPRSTRTRPLASSSIRADRSRSGEEYRRPRDDVRQMGEESQGRRRGIDKDRSEPERAELERLRKETPHCAWSVTSQKKWRPGSRKNSREVRGDRGLGRRTSSTRSRSCAPSSAVARQGYYRWLADGPCERERHRRRAHRADPRDPRRGTDIPACAGSGPSSSSAGLRGRPQAGLATDARRRPARTPPAGLETHHRRWSAAHRRPGPDRAGLHRHQPDTRWCGDITYVQTVDGWVYTATVIDLHSRKVVGYAVADHLRTSLIVEALAARSGPRRPPPG